MKYSGTKGVYRIHVVNNGNAVAEAVRVAAALPSQAMFQSAGLPGVSLSVSQKGAPGASKEP